MRGLVAIAVLMPGVALACALPPSILLTLPTGHYIAGAAATVAVTGLLAAAPQWLPRLGARTLMTRRVLVPQVVSSSLSFLVFLTLLMIGFFGARDPLHNLLTLAVWTGLWVALPMAIVVFGNLWRPLNPWTGPVRIARILLGRTTSVGVSRLGYWPAVAGLFGFFWFYRVSMSPDDPQTLATVALVYWLVIFVLAVADGEEWLTSGEFLTVYMTWLAKIAPFWLEVTGKTAHLRIGWPGSQVLALPALTPSAVGFVTLALAGLTFDGLAETFWWLALIGENPLEFTGRSAVIWVNTAGLLGTWALTSVTILAALQLSTVLAAGPEMATATGGLKAGDLASSQADLRPVLLSFLAIAAGYHAAHYLMTLLTTGQYTLAALNDPLFRGDAFLGLSPFFVSMGFLTERGMVTAIWTAQFALILGAHVLALILALRLSGPHVPARAHLPLTGLMVGYTVLGLWLLSAPRGF